MDRRSLIISFLSSLFLFGYVPAFGQSYQFQQTLLSTEDGLSNLMTKCIDTDNEGFIWIGTKYGLNKYDGYKFTSFLKDKNGLAQNDGIRLIEDDNEGNLWIFYNGLIREKGNFPHYDPTKIDVFNKVTEKAVPFDLYYKGKAPFKASDAVILNIRDAKKRNWILTRKGALYLYNGDFVKIYESIDTHQFSFLTTDENDNIWLSNKNSLIQIDLQGNLKNSLTLSNDIIGIWTEKDKVWIATIEAFTNEIQIWQKKGISIFKEFHLKKENQQITINSHNIYQFVRRGTDGTWWIKNGVVLQVFDEKGQWIHNFKDPEDRNTMYNFEDGLYIDDRLWVTSPIGVYKFSIRKNKFQIIHTRKNYSDSRGITEDDNGNIYFSDKYIYKWNPLTGEKTRLSSDGTNFGSQLFYYEKYIYGSPYNWHYPLLGVNTQETNNSYLVFNSIAFNSFVFWRDSAKQKILIGGEEGLASFDLNEKQVASHAIKAPSFQILNETRINFIYSNQYGIWLATNEGLFLLNSEWEAKGHFSRENHELPFNGIQHICEDKNGVFWLATKGGGIIRWKYSPEQKQTVTTRQFTAIDGLSHNITYAIYEDEYEKLWISSDQGLMKFDKNNFEVTTFSTEDGLSHREFNFSSHYKAKDGKLYFGGLGGIISFHPRDFNTIFRSKFH